MSAKNTADGERYWLYGLHAVRAALRNPRRRIHRFLATTNAARRLEAPPGAAAPETVDVRALNRLLGEAVHQGVALEVDPLPLGELDDLCQARLVLCLDQVTDPHNVGAILRSAAAFGADAVVVTRRHSAAETGALAKSASGALDLVPVVAVTNLARGVETLGDAGFRVTALDSEAGTLLSALAPAERRAFVLGAEGKGVRPGVIKACDEIAAIEAPGALASLNVSNAAAVTLYVARQALLTQPAAPPG
jgi:23S rRNA (guanosine2251-2'-O)-methyltransferase